MPFKPTYLYVKTHRVSGLKYFGKTTQLNPRSYRGSGVDWVAHLTENGNLVDTEIIGLYHNKEECKDAAIQFSIDNDIVNSSRWANKVIENGLGGKCDQLTTPSFDVQLQIKNIQTMNTKILKLFVDAVTTATLGDVEVNENTHIEALHITPRRMQTLKETIETELEFPFEIVGTIGDMVRYYDAKYLTRFFGEIWKPRTDHYGPTGWGLVDEVNSHGFKNVLDVGCGYHPFKGRINNLVGIDPFNNCADYMVDILDYKVKPESHDCIIALGSINFNSRDEIDARFSHCVNLLSKGGKFYLRANPGKTHVNGEYVDIFDWNFAVVNEFAEKYNLHLDTFKQDHDRLYFVYTKIS